MQLWHFFIMYFAAVNIAAYFLMRADKIRAQNNEWRIEESLLLVVCLCGGFVGTHFAMEHFRHKTKHWKFHFAVILSAVIFLIVFPIIFFLRFRSLI